MLKKEDFKAGTLIVQIARHIKFNQCFITQAFNSRFDYEGSDYYHIFLYSEKYGLIDRDVNYNYFNSWFEKI